MPHQAVFETTVLQVNTVGSIQAFSGHFRQSLFTLTHNNRYIYICSICIVANNKDVRYIHDSPVTLMSLSRFNPGRK